jgi:ABC-type transport system involved in multi-copper enzyme maturation permease subunit
MIWLTWRQFRTQTIAALVLLAAAAVYLLITGTQMRHAYNADLAGCPALSDCPGVFNGLQDQYNGPLDLVELIVLAAPALIGIFWGAPLIAGELEHGTHHMVWNQSVTRTRWLAVKFGCIAIASVAAAGLLSLLATWWASPLDTITGNRFGVQTFNARNIAPLGYALFAFALGVTLGLLIRRTLPAMAVTIAVFVAIQVLVTAGLRPNLLPSTGETVALNQTSMSQAIRFDRSDATTGDASVDLPGPAGAWIVSESPILDSTGQPIHDSEIASCFAQDGGPAFVVPAVKARTSDFATLGACLAPHDLHVDITYQPAGHYWPLQWIETALYTVLAALLTAATFRRIGRLRG